MDETCNSDSSDGSIIIPSSSVIPESPSASDPAFESYKSQQFVIVDHTANIRNGSIIEAYECLKAWWKNNLIEQQEGHVHYKNKKPKK
jgi:hypothetical protein